LGVEIEISIEITSRQIETPKLTLCSNQIIKGTSADSKFFCTIATKKTN
jgi:hypothetical protein